MPFKMVSLNGSNGAKEEKKKKKHSYDFHGKNLNSDMNAQGRKAKRKAVCLLQ